MSTEKLADAMDKYLATVGSVERQAAAGGVAAAMRVALREARRRLLEHIDRVEARVLGGARQTPADDAGHILVATDGSNPATWAVRVASRLAALAGKRLVILHVINPTTAVSPELMYVTEEARASMQRHADELLTSARAIVPADVPVEELLREGEAAEQIIAAAREWEADLVVLGTRGRGRLAAFLLGSTAEQVVRGAHCPVVTVGHDPEQVPVTEVRTPSVGRAETVGATE